MRDVGITPSMGAVSPPWGNAATEIFGWAECFCSGARSYSVPCCLSPGEFERANLPDKEGRREAA